MNNKDLINAVSESISTGTIIITDIPELKIIVDQSIQKGVDDYISQNFDQIINKENLKSLIKIYADSEVNKISKDIIINNNILKKDQSDIKRKMDRYYKKIDEAENQIKETTEKAFDSKVKINKLNQKLEKCSNKINHLENESEKYDKLINSRYFIFGLVLFALLVGIIIGVVFL